MTAVVTSRRIGWLPGVGEGDVAACERRQFGEGVELVLPRLTPDGLLRLAQRVAAARDDYLAGLPVWRVVTLLDRVASRWLDPASPYRREAERLLPEITGFHPTAVRKGLASYLSFLRQENLARLLAEELPDPLVLDQLRPRLSAGGGETRAFGPRLTVHVWSGNVPGLPAQSLASALLAKSASIGKVASEEPLFPTLLAESVAEVDPRLAECLAVVWWQGGDAEQEAVAFGAAEAVIAYGGEAAIGAIRRAVPPTARLVTYSHKLSFGAVAREALRPEALADTADRAAYDVAKFDQQGCLSPHLLYVEAGGAAAPLEFARALSDALARYDDLVPRGRLSLEEQASAAALRHAFEVRAMRGEDVAVFGGADGGWSVLYDPDPTFQPSCLNRTVRVLPVGELERDVPRLVAPVRQYLQTCGVAAEQERRRAVAEALGRLGLDRVCPLGRMADVAATWHHDGRCQVAELLRWTDLEPDATAGRWELAHPDLGIYGA